MQALSKDGFGVLCQVKVESCRETSFCLQQRGGPVTANQPGLILAPVPLCSLRGSYFQERGVGKELKRLYISAFGQAYLAQLLTHTCHSRVWNRHVELLWFYSSLFIES